MGLIYPDDLYGDVMCFDGALARNESASADDCRPARSLHWTHLRRKAENMSKESAKKFVRRLLDDDEFLAKIASVEGGERRKQTEAAGFDFTTEELQEAKAEHLSAADETRKPAPEYGGIQPLYGVIDTWEA